MAQPIRPAGTGPGTDRDSGKPGLFVVGFAVVFGLVVFFAAMSVITHIQ